jgi:peptide/nickel transport system substrate-binding protein
MRPLFVRVVVVALAMLSLARAETAAAAPEGTLTWGVHVTLAARWLDPSDTEAFITPFMVLYALHDALVKPMPGGDNTPSLAESWTASKDGLAYEFVLRKGVKFHNGDPVTADDVKYSFDRYHGAAAKLLKDRVREVQIVDPGRVRFQLKEPWPDFMTFYGTSATGAAWIVPKKYVEKVGEDGFKKAPVGAGPYKFVAFNPGIDLVMEAFEGYWRKVPNVKRLVFKSMPDETTRAAALKAGDVDIVYLLSGPVAADIKRTAGLRLAAAMPPGVVFLDMPEQWDPKSPWADKRVRLAASYALDRNALNLAETLGLSRPTGGLVPRVLEFAKAFDPPAHDPARAKKLLAEAGYASGFDAATSRRFRRTSRWPRRIGNYLQGSRHPHARPHRWSARRSSRVARAQDQGRHHGARRSRRQRRDAHRGLRDQERYLRQWGRAGDRGSLPGAGRELDRKKRERMLHEIQQIMYDRALHVPIYELAFLWGVGPRVEEACVDHIKGFSYSAPYEDLKIRRGNRRAAVGNRVGDAAGTEALQPQEARVAGATGHPGRGRIVAGGREAVVDAQCEAAPDDLGLRQRDERRVNRQPRAALDPIFVARSAMR